MFHSQINASKDTENLKEQKVTTVTSVHNIIKMRKKFLKGLSFEYCH